MNGMAIVFSLKFREISKKIRWQGVVTKRKRSLLSIIFYWKKAVRNSNVDITLDGIVEIKLFKPHWVDRLSWKVFLNCVNMVFKNYEQLAEAVESYPCLYNKQEKDFKKVTYLLYINIVTAHYLDAWTKLA